MPSSRRSSTRCSSSSDKGEPIINSELVISLLGPPFPRGERPAGGNALPGRHARLLHPDQRRHRGLLLLPADRQHQGAVGPRDLVRPQGPGDPQADRRVRPPLPLHLPLPEDLGDKVKMGLTILNHQKRRNAHEELIETIAPVGSLS